MINVFGSFRMSCIDYLCVILCCIHCTLLDCLALEVSFFESFWSFYTMMNVFLQVLGCVALIIYVTSYVAYTVQCYIAEHSKFAFLKALRRSTL